MYNLIKRRAIYDSEWISLYVDAIKDNELYIPEYHVIHYKKESVVIIVVKDNKILFIKAVRYISNAVEIELPAGYIENGESPIEAAQRELSEETGIVSKNIKLLYTFNPSNGMSDQIVHVIIAEHAGGTETVQKGETAGVIWLNKEQINDLIASKGIVDGVTLAALAVRYISTGSSAIESLLISIFP